MWKLRKSWSVTALVLLALLDLHACFQGSATRYFMENSHKATSRSKPGNLNDEAEYHECYITVQETRRIGGQCVKIRENFQGCVAGSLMDPFHEDCL